MPTLKQKPKPLNKEDCYWLAGLLEGEGCFHTEKCIRAYGTYYYPAFTIGMTDEDVINKAAKVCRVSYQSHQPSRSRTKRVHSFRVRGTRATLIMDQILPLMGQRRSKKIRELLEKK